jgi:hypothetical protein
MKTIHLKVAKQSAVLIIALACAVNLRAATSATPQASSGCVTSQTQFQTIGYGDFSESKSLTRAYLILATGDRDYKGHRKKAMHEVETAAKLLGMDVRSDAVGHKPQALSDDRLREARGLLEKVLGASEVQAQKRISKHVTAAINQINDALTVH